MSRHRADPAYCAAELSRAPIRVALAQVGLRVTLVGRVAQPAEPLDAPLTVATCASWQLISNNTGEDWSADDLLIEDDSGRVLVRMAHADVDLAGADECKLEMVRSKRGSTIKNGPLCVVQRLLQPGDQVVVAGLAAGHEIDPAPEIGRLRTGFRDAPRVLVVAGGPDDPVLLRYRSG